MLEGQEDVDLQESSEQDDSEYDAGWDLDAKKDGQDNSSDGGNDADNKPGDDKNTDGDDENTENDGDDGDGEGDDGESNDTEKTAQEKLEDRANVKKQADGDKKEGQEGAEDSDGRGTDGGEDGETEGPESDQRGDAQVEITDDDVESILSYPIPLPDKIKLPSGEDVTLKEIEEDFGEMANYSKLIAAYMADETVTHYLKDFEPGGDHQELNSLRESNEALTKRLDELEANLAVAEKHPDFRTIKGDKGFEGWLKKQSSGVQKLAESPDAEDRIYILDAYKEMKSRDTAKKVDAENAKEKDRYDKLHSGTLRSKPASEKKKGGKDMDDYNAGWNDA